MDAAAGSLRKLVSTVPDRCRRCYSCVRRCPAKAIRVRAGQAEVVPERCVACGRCINVCSQAAKVVADNLGAADRLLATGRAVVLLAPSFPAAFTQWLPGQVIAALRRCGFAGVHEVAFGADLVSRVYRERYAGDPARFTLTTPCPAAVSYIQKYAVELLPFLAPVLSPMAAMGKALKTRLRPGCRTVFAGPCIAKMHEIEEGDVAPWVDGVITFAEVLELFARRGIDPSALPEETYDPPHAHLGGIFPVPSGLLRAARLPSDLLYNEVIEVSGMEDFTDVVARLSERVRQGKLANLESRFFDLLFCKGCVAGPVMPSSGSFVTRKERIVSFLHERRNHLSEEEWEAAMDGLADLDLGRAFSADDQRRPEPSEEEIRRILARTGKLSAADELNCRACGYRSCRDKAIAVHQGVAEEEMCLPHLVERLQATVAKLNSSYEQLTDAQAQLIRSERLASMGQLAAGIAHEVNNPLGTILIYAHLLAETVEDGAGVEAAQLKGDIEMILAEATRCKSIVGGLLDFARQNKVQRAMVDVGDLLAEATRIIEAQNREARIAFEVVPPAGQACANLDREQMLQVLLNLVRNAVEVMPEGGRVRVAAEWLEGGDLRLTVSDTGPGIPPEHMRKLFNPFFTTKPVGKGTGLGLPICYGIVKMHRGSITARNNQGAPGATFEIVLPAASEERGNGAQESPDR